MTVDPRSIREKSKITQDKFWPALGVTQSGGSRYEAGRRMPIPTRLVMDIAYNPGPARKAALEALLIKSTDDAHDSRRKRDLIKELARL